jgi:hypothetical protein
VYLKIEKNDKTKIDIIGHLSELVFKGGKIRRGGLSGLEK